MSAHALFDGARSPPSGQSENAPAIICLLAQVQSVSGGLFCSASRYDRWPRGEYLFLALNVFGYCLLAFLLGAVRAVNLDKAAVAGAYQYLEIDGYRSERVH
jgi:hypothetical protein